MKTLEDGKIYRLDHTGVISAAFIESRPLENETIVFDQHRAWTLMGYATEETESGLRFMKEDSYYEFSPLTLESATEIFPDTIRVFKDLSVLEEFARKAIHLAESYNVNTTPEEVISFTVSEEDQVLALIKVTDTGDMFYWNQDDWTQVTGDEDLPSVYDQQLIDVEPSDIGSALELWKDAVASARTLTKEDILVYAALNQ